MLLKRLELHGFKSFARETKLEFHTPITAVVGPNGSGKSNIAEAIRFVLGEQSMKTLRSKRGEDLIFHGSGSGGTRGALGRASVAIVFDNSAGTFNVDYNEVEIKRVVHRDGTNYYTVNGTRVRLKDILELLGAAHIGSSSHHIISQGETDRILNASVKERRTMIEDALGLRIYQYKRTESERKLAKTRENMAQTESLRRELAPHLKFLERQAEKVRQAEQFREHLAEEYRVYLANQNALLVKREQELSREEDALKKEEALLNERLKELSVKEEPHGQQSEEPREVGEKEAALRELQTRKDALARELGRIEGKIDYLEQEIKKSDSQPSDDTVTLSKKQLEVLRTTAREHIQAARENGSVEALTQALAAIEALIEEFAGQEEPRGEAAESDNSRREEYEHAREAYKKAEAELKEIAAEENRLREELIALRKDAESKQVQNLKEERELFELRAKKSDLDARARMTAFNRERLDEEKRALQNEYSEALRFLGEEAEAFSSLPAPAELLPQDDLAARKKTIERLKIKIEEVGTGGRDILREYEEMKERDEYLARELDDMERTAASLETLIDDLGARIESQFKDGIKKINAEFQELFSVMFGGGRAALKLAQYAPRQKQATGDEEGEEEPEETEEGVEITVDLPTKRIKGLQALSGGERSLTSIALIFAMTQVNPPPFLVLDETDAALDESNSKKYSTMLKELASKTQFIVITHNRETMTHAGVLYGVTSNKEGVSHILSVKLDEAEELTE